MLKCNDCEMKFIGMTGMNIKNRIKIYNKRKTTWSEHLIEKGRTCEQDDV